MFFLLLYELVVADDLSPASLLQLQAERQLRLSARQDREDGNSEVDDPLRQSAELLEDILVEDMVEERVGHGVPLAKRMTERRHDISGAGMRHGHLAETIDQPSQGEGAATPRVLVVGTHHKTGTFLVENLLQEMQKSILDAGCWKMSMDGLQRFCLFTCGIPSRPTLRSSKTALVLEPSDICRLHVILCH